ncbi:MAG: hypothetical protein QNJ00_12470 [Woeseiaceae bacterium]|nr:hypothetical protein [Woeseiaceae bacterium]
MAKTAWIALIAAGLGAAHCCCADEADDTPIDTSPLATSIDELPDRWAYTDWRLLDAVETSIYATDWAQPEFDVDFEDNSTLARLKRLKSVSLLTLAESEKSRLFLGVNEDGFLGLHFRASPKVSNERSVELVRLPYLDDEEEDEER